MRDYKNLDSLREINRAFDAKRKEPAPTLLEAILSGVGFFILVFYFLWTLGA